MHVSSYLKDDLSAIKVPRIHGLHLVVCGQEGRTQLGPLLGTKDLHAQGAGARAKPK